MFPDSVSGVLKAAIPVVTFDGSGPKAAQDFLCPHGDTSKPRSADPAILTMTFLVRSFLKQVLLSDSEVLLIVRKLQETQNLLRGDS